MGVVVICQSPGPLGSRVLHSEQPEKLDRGQLDPVRPLKFGREGRKRKANVQRTPSNVTTRGVTPVSR